MCTGDCGLVADRGVLLLETFGVGSVSEWVNDCEEQVVAY